MTLMAIVHRIVVLHGGQILNRHAIAIRGNHHSKEYNLRAANHLFTGCAHPERNALPNLASPQGERAKAGEDESVVVRYVRGRCLYG